MGLQAYLMLAAVVFCIGLFGVVTRRNTIGILLGIELMLNAVNINLVAFAASAAATSGMVFTRLHHLHHRGGSGARPGDRHPAVPRPPHGDGGSPGSAQGMMADPGTPRPRRAAAARARRSSCWRRGAAAPARPAGGVVLDSRAPPASLGRGRRWRGAARRRRDHALVWPWLPSERQAARDVGVLADATSTVMLVPGRAGRVPGAGLFARLPERRAAAGARPLLRATSRCSRSR